MPISANNIAFIVLANEYCQALETAAETDPEEFIKSMLRLLPRLYMTATDLEVSDEDWSGLDDNAFTAQTLDEDYYEAVRRSIENILGPDDTYLEVFEEDMKYSDTPIAASISEGLTDLFQVMYNFIATVRDATETTIISAIADVKEEFGAYWSQIICNTLRALNHVRYSNR